jgi:hypothetical protein
VVVDVDDEAYANEIGSSVEELDGCKLVDGAVQVQVQVSPVCEL